jgi:hypothetical protein
MTKGKLNSYALSRLYHLSANLSERGAARQAAPSGRDRRLLEPGEGFITLNQAAWLCAIQRKM